MMGASNPHPHGQIWSNETIPNETVKELKNFVNYHEKNKRGLLADYLKSELEKGERVVHENDSFVALVPFWAVYPFETLIVSRRQVGAISDLNDAERDGLADILHQTTANYDQTFRHAVSVHDGFSSATDRRRRVSRISSARAFLSAAAPFGDDSQIYGRLRTFGFAAARHHARSCRRNVTQPEGEIMQLIKKCSESCF